MCEKETINPNQNVNITSERWDQEDVPKFVWLICLLQLLFVWPVFDTGGHSIGNCFHSLLFSFASKSDGKFRGLTLKSSALVSLSLLLELMLLLVLVLVGSPEIPVRALLRNPLSFSPGSAGSTFYAKNHPFKRRLQGLGLVSQACKSRTQHSHFS